MTINSSLDALRDRASELLDRAYVPFSKAPTAAVLLLDSGRTVPGVRVESASYSITIPALLNAYTTAVATGHRDSVAAFVLSRPFRREEGVYVEELPGGPYEPWADDVWLRSDMAGNGALAQPDEPVSPYYNGPVETESEGIDKARAVADRAHVPTSSFPVGALAELPDGRLVPGVNVEHPDWARVLCAERNALGTIQSYGLDAPMRLFLTCLEEAEGTPCGACRQVLAELAPETTLWMDRHADPPEEATIGSLLPGSFQGRALLDAS